MYSERDQCLQMCSRTLKRVNLKKQLLSTVRYAKSSATDVRFERRKNEKLLRVSIDSWVHRKKSKSMNKLPKSTQHRLYGENEVEALITTALTSLPMFKCQISWTSARKSPLRKRALGQRRQQWRSWQDDRCSAPSSAYPSFLWDLSGASRVGRIQDYQARSHLSASWNLATEE